ncbi:hypothetical protein BD413DRAFT_597870 [Trametes elegans]|nr:hypothetical protein BD413DRAFT_597870 [Trametes elegans]
MGSAIKALQDEKCAGTYSRSCRLRMKVSTLRMYSIRDAGFVLLVLTRCGLDITFQSHLRAHPVVLSNPLTNPERTDHNPSENEHLSWKVRSVSLTCEVLSVLFLLFVVAFFWGGALCSERSTLRYLHPNCAVSALRSIFTSMLLVSLGGC